MYSPNTTGRRLTQPGMSLVHDPKLISAEL